MKKRLVIKFKKIDKYISTTIVEQFGISDKQLKKFLPIKDFKPQDDYGSCFCGVIDEWDTYVDDIKFNSSIDCNTYLKKIVDTITDELFTGKGELKVGERCMVSDDGEMLQDSGWFTLELLAILPNSIEKRYICRMPFATWDSKAWKYARSIAKRIEPKIEECGNVVTYTWEEK